MDEMTAMEEVKKLVEAGVAVTLRSKNSTSALPPEKRFEVTMSRTLLGSVTTGYGSDLDEAIRQAIDLARRAGGWDIP
jgi:hypothetical protein